MRLFKRKRNLKPTIRKAYKVSCNPEETTVLLSQQTLFEIASEYEAEILETPEAYILLTQGLNFIALKRKGES